MRPNLSLEYLAATLAALGTGIIVAACGGSHQDAKASEVPAASKPLPWQGDKACAAHGCGAAPSASSTGDPGGSSATAPATSAAAGSGASATPTAAATATSTTSAPASPAPSSSAQAATPKPAPKPAARRPKPAAGDASCGQGTCSTDPKKM